MHRSIAAFFILTLLVSPLLSAEEEVSVIDAADLQRGSGAVDSIRMEDLAKSRALQLFVLHKFEDALREFNLLTVIYPSDIVIKRYIGACLAELRRDDEALAAFSGILISAPDDLPTHKMMAKMSLRRGETAQAKRHLEKMMLADATDGPFAVYAEDQLKKLKTIERSSPAPASGQMGAEEFMRSKAVILFMDAEYEKALPEFVSLEVLYPRDVMVKRYKGMTQDKLGRPQEAVRTFEEGLKEFPDNEALRYAMAQALFHDRKMEESAAVLKKLAQSEIHSDYRIRAGRDLEAIERIETIQRDMTGKKWSLSVEHGFEFNSNASSEPTKRQISAEEHAVRFPGSMYFNYILRQEAPWSVSAGYAYIHSFYSDTLDTLNYRVHAPSLNLAYIGDVGGRPLLTMVSPSYVHVTVDGKQYYQNYGPTFRMIYSWWDWQRLILTDRIGWTEYKTESETPDTLSRSGLSHSINVTNNFYLNQKQDLYVAVGYEHKAEDAEGSDYVRNVNQVNVDLNFPVWRDWTGLASFRYKNSDYPEITQPIQRNDDEYLMGSRLTVPLNKTLSLKLYYDYLLSDSNEPYYKFTNHSGGASLAANF